MGWGVAQWLACPAVDAAIRHRHPTKHCKIAWGGERTLLVPGHSKSFKKEFLCSVLIYLKICNCSSETERLLVTWGRDCLRPTGRGRRVPSLYATGACLPRTRTASGCRRPSGAADSNSSAAPPASGRPSGDGSGAPGHQ